MTVTEVPRQQARATARTLSAIARRVAPATEEGRRLPEELVAALGESGLLRAGAPREAGGLELDPGTALRCAEEIARGDASAGWCVSIGITSSLLVAYLPPAGRDELFGAGRGLAAGVWAPRGTARRVADGLVVSGRWAFCSGVSHADVLFAGCLVEGDPLPRVVALPTSDLQVLDTWRTLGLRGTGSHDAVADEVHVPDRRVLSLLDGPVVDRALYRFPIFGFFALSVAAAALGNARAAVEELLALAGDKVALGASKPLAARVPTHVAVATAEASLRSARSYYHDAVETAWQSAQRGGPVAVAERTDLRLAATHAARTSAEVVRTMFDLGGAAATYDDAPLQRRFRDAHTITAHFQVNEASRELPGRILLGQPTDATML